MVNSDDIVITGVGALSSIGIGKEVFWKNLLAGKSGISAVSRFDSREYETHIAGEVINYQPKVSSYHYDGSPRGRAEQFAIDTTIQALTDAGVSSNQLPIRTGVCLGTTLADAPAIEAFDDEMVQQGWVGRDTAIRMAMQFPSCVLAARVAEYIGASGKVAMIPTACAAGNYAIAYAADLIRLGKSEMMIAGGVDPFSRYAFGGFDRLRALAPDNCRPFDANRKGTVIGEGAGIVILESAAHAASRGAMPYAKVMGYGMSCDAHHMTIPTVEGVHQAMSRALTDARVTSHEVDYISAHGTGTPANDRTESAAIKQLFGRRTHRVPVSSIKSMLGHTMGAASALEAISCVLAIRTSRVPPTINFESPDSACDIDCVPNAFRELTVDIALNNSFAFGGNNACLVFGKA